MNQAQKNRFDELKTSVQLLMERGETEAALSSLQKNLASFSDLRDYYGLFVRPLTQMGFLKEARLIMTLVERFDSRSFLQLGCHFAEQRLFYLAIPLLQEAHKKNPERGDIIHELALCFSSEGHHQKALELLDQHPQKETNFWVRYEKAWNSLFVGKLKEACQEREWLENAIEDAPPEQKTSVFFAYQKLKDTLLRFQLSPKPQKNFWKWHFILYGGSLIEALPDVKPSGFQEGEGIGQIGSFGKMVQKTTQWIKDLYPETKKIFWLADEDSEICGRCLVHLLEIPGEPLKHMKLNQTQNSLVVSARAGDFSPEFLDIQPGQILFSPSLSFQNPLRVCPDLVGFFLREPFIFPWALPGKESPQEFLNYFNNRSAKEIDKLLDKGTRDVQKFPQKKFYQKAKPLLMAGNSENYPFGRYSFSGEQPFPIIKMR